MPLKYDGPLYGKGGARRYFRLVMTAADVNRIVDDLEALRQTVRRYLDSNNTPEAVAAQAELRKLVEPSPP